MTKRGLFNREIVCVGKIEALNPNMLYLEAAKSHLLKWATRIETRAPSRQKKGKCTLSIWKGRPGRSSFQYRHVTVLIALLEEKQPKNKWTIPGPRGTNGSGNGCHDNSKEESTKGITNTCECKCIWHWIMWTHSLADPNTIFELGKNMLQRLSHAGFILVYRFYSKG